MLWQQKNRLLKQLRAVKYHHDVISSTRYSQHQKKCCCAYNSCITMQQQQQQQRRHMTSKSSTVNKKNKVAAAAATAKHAKPSILSATILSLADATGSVGGGFSAAISMAIKATGISLEDGAYSIILGILPLCVGYTFYGLLEDTKKKDDKKEETAGYHHPRVYWPEAFAFATAATIIGKGMRLLVGLWSPIPSGKELDARHLRANPLIRTASQGLFSFVIIGAGSAAILRSYKQYIVHEPTDDSNEENSTNNDDRAEEENNSLQRLPVCEEEGLWECLLRVKSAFSQQILTQFRKAVEDDDYGNTSNHVRQFTMAGAATGLGTYLIGPSAYSLPVPLLVYLCNNGGNGHHGCSKEEVLSPHEVFHTLVASAVPYLLLHAAWFRRLGARPRLKLFLPFGIGVAATYGMAESLVLPHMPDYTTNLGFGLIALAGGGLKLIGSVRGVRKLL